MAEVVRSFIKYLSEALSSHRRALRRTAHLPLIISLADPQPRHHKEQNRLTCSGWVRDISAMGLSFIVPTVRLGSQHLFADGEIALKIEVELPTGQISFCAQPTHYELLDKDDCGRNFLIGARITKMNDSDRVQLVKYLRAFKRNAARYPSRQMAPDQTSLFEGS